MHFSFVVVVTAAAEMTTIYAATQLYFSSWNKNTNFESELRLGLL
jgi:hypothetical protein